MKVLVKDLPAPALSPQFDMFAAFTPLPQAQAMKAAGCNKIYEPPLVEGDPQFGLELRKPVEIGGVAARMAAFLGSWSG